MDDELNLTPISDKIENIEEINDTRVDQVKKELQSLQDQFASTNVLGQLLKIAITIDQVQVILKIYEVLQKKSNRDVISLTAARGRGKSSSIGLAISAAIFQGLSQIYVCAPNPSNIKTLFQFCIKGLIALGYKETTDYEVIYSTNEEFKHSTIRINIFKSYKQTIQYILPEDADKIGNNDLLVIDEAASIPLQYIKNMMGPYPVFMSSTVNGYEGTGRSLSLKLIDQMRRLNNQDSQSGRFLTELSMEQPIRYSLNDPIEQWLNKLLLLDATQGVPLQQSLPHPKDCSLYMINRDTLFSGKQSSEKFLFNLMSLFISSHYKNSPNDLQLLSDAPQHQVFVLMQTIDRTQKIKQLPDILCAIQICFEGGMSSQFIQQQQTSSLKPSGDMIPWVVSEQFQDTEFGKLNGVRIVRIATHPNVQKQGYGSKSIELLNKFFEGQLVDLNDVNYQTFDQVTEHKLGQPILKDIQEIQPPKIDYLGVSYGLTKQLYNFWDKNSFHPIYLKQQKNEITTEHTCIMLKQIQQESNDWLKLFAKDFKKRFLTLLQNDFKNLFSPIAFALIKNKINNDDQIQDIEDFILTKEHLQYYFSEFDFKRLDSFCKDMADFYLILDLLPQISKLYFLNKFKDLSMSAVQQTILVGQGLQFKSVDQISKELNIQSNQLIALFKKAIKKFKNYIADIYKQGIEQKIQEKTNIKLNNPILGVDLQEEGQKQIKQIYGDLAKKQKFVEKNKKYEIDDFDEQQELQIDENNNIQVKRDKQIVNSKKQLKFDKQQKKSKQMK